jgi:hypothetical protein
MPTRKPFLVTPCFSIIRWPGCVTALSLGLIALAVAARLFALLALGPVETPDSSLYIAQADCILKTLNGAVVPCPAATFKSVGYGFVILSFVKAFGSAWDWGLTFFQTGLSLFSSLLLARASLALTKSFPLAALCFAMHSLSLPLMIDPWILRDSIFASLLTIFISYVVWHVSEESPLRWSAALCLGLILGVAAALREQFVYYAIFFLPLVFVGLRAAHASLTQALVILLLLAGPVVLTRIGLESWNKAMTGQAVVSTNARTVMLQPVLPVARQYTDLFNGDTELDKAARAAFRTYKYSEVVDLNKLLLSRGISPEAISRLAIAKYFETWRRYPLPLGLTVANRFLEGGVTSAFNPGKAILLQKGYAKHDPVYFSARRSLQKAVAQGDVPDATFALLWFAGDFISYAIIISAWAIGLASSYRLLFSEQVRRHDDVIVALFTAYLGVLLTHAMVHLEPRQIAGVMGIPLLLALCFWHRLAQRQFKKRPHVSRLEDRLPGWKALR